jgi:hypothetical protein
MCQPGRTVVPGADMVRENPGGSWLWDDGGRMLGRVRSVGRSGAVRTTRGAASSTPRCARWRARFFPFRIII